MDERSKMLEILVCSYPMRRRGPYENVARARTSKYQLSPYTILLGMSLRDDRASSRRERRAAQIRWQVDCAKVA